MPDRSHDFATLQAEFSSAGIPTDSPGFYDHPAFLERERRDPEYLFNYGRFVQWRPYDAPYLERAERVIRVASEELHRGLLLDGRLGACIDVSMVLARILDRHGVWNFMVRGALTITFVQETGHAEPFTVKGQSAAEFYEKEIRPKIDALAF